MLDYLFYFLIFFAKIIEVSLMTLRTVLITKGEKVLGSVVGFFEVVIWIIVVSKVLSDLQNDPLKMVVYALGFACGIYVGIMFEERLALGLSTIQVILSMDDGDNISNLLREHGLGVTTLDGEGKDTKKLILLIHLKRKKIDEIVKLIQDNSENAMITINDTKVVYGGFGGLKK
jgi:uncharacterized protein YebE (UPF0316 family)